MENIPPGLFVPIGAVTAALIAGFFSFLNLVISKEQKVSEFRQEWIGKLRDDLCRYVASIRYLSGANQTWINQGYPDPLKHYENMRLTVEAASHAYCSVRLLLNPDGKDKAVNKLTDDFIAKLDIVKKHTEANKYDDARSAAEELVEKLQPILKCEWSRVKKGEPIYRITRGIAFSIIIFGFLGGIFLSYHYYGKLPNQPVVCVNHSICPTP